MDGAATLHCRNTQARVDTLSYHSGVFPDAKSGTENDVSI